MKRLENIRVVQFFLFERQEILLDEITGIFGPNASGKSSMLDAVQIAMFGGNSRLVALNAQADEEQRTTRSLRSYCLGQFGENIDDRARDNATTYITLIWRDTVTGAPLSMGLCISASADREGHEVLGRYILPGVELMMSDHLEFVDGQERPREWSTFRHQLMGRSRISGDDPLFNDAQRYINAVLLSLRGSDSIPHTESFIRAFRFALRMRFDKSVDQIVRQDVLEASPTNIKKFREVTESFRRLAELVAQVETKIADGRKVEIDFIKAADESRRAATWDTMGKMAAVEVANEALNQASDARAIVEEDLETKRIQLASLDSQIVHANQEAMRFRIAKEAHASHKDYGTLQLEIHAANQRGQDKTRSLRADLGVMCRTLSDALQSAFLKDFSQEISTAAAFVGDLISKTEKLSTVDVNEKLRPALKVAEKARDDLHRQDNVLKQKLNEARERLKDANAALQRVKEGRAPLTEYVQRLMSELQDHGLHPVPVCDLVKITDAAWQPVIESYLSVNLQALLVSGDEEKQAFKIYRGLTGHRAIYGAKIAMESRQQIGRSTEPGSVAELIEGDHPAAVAFLRRNFGDIMRVATDSEALSGKRTLTQDGMLVSGGEFDRLRPIPASKFMIGAGSAIHHGAMQQEVGALAKEVSAFEGSLKNLEMILNSLRLIANEDLVVKSVLDALSEIERAENEAQGKTLQLQGMADEEYVLLGQREQEWAVKAKGVGDERDVLNRELGFAEKSLETKLAEENRAHEKAQEASVAEEQSRSQPEYDHNFWLSQWDRIIESFDEKPIEMAEHCNQQRDYAKKRMADAIARGMREFGVFLEKYREQTLMDTSSDWSKAHAWLSEMLDRLDKTELAIFKEDMDAAYRTSQETFRNDVAIALHNNLEFLSETMDRLNGVLRSCPTFSNGERYRFRRNVRPELESLLKFVKDVATYGPTQDLLGGAGDIPEAFKALLDDKVASGAAGVKSPLDDYREFFDFDIEILREDPITKESRVVGHLSKRLGPGSGGEHRSPLYVIAGAALASAYRLDRGNRDGLRLMLLDEAFNKMDMTNIIATMRYLEELGLQVFMASPGENLGTLTAFLHRYYDILRDAENNTVMFEGHSVSKDVRALFKEDLPEFNPGLVEQEVASMRATLIAEIEQEVATK